MDSHVVPGQVRYWVGGAVGAALVGILLAISAGGIALRLPLPAYPVAVALGALIAFLGVVRGLALVADRRAPASREERG